MNQYVGIPFADHACWSLCQRVYREQFGIRLPDTGGDAPRSQVLAEPVEGCLVRVVRAAPLAEHWGVYTRGHVLHAQRPASAMVPLARFLSRHPQVQFVQVHP